MAERDGGYLRLSGSYIKSLAGQGEPQGPEAGREDLSGAAIKRLARPEPVDVSYDSAASGDARAQTLQRSAEATRQPAPEPGPRRVGRLPDGTDVFEAPDGGYVDAEGFPVLDTSEAGPRRLPAELRAPETLGERASTFGRAAGQGATGTVATAAKPLALGRRQLQDELRGYQDRIARAGEMDEAEYETLQRDIAKNLPGALRSYTARVARDVRRGERAPGEVDLLAETGRAGNPAADAGEWLETLGEEAFPLTPGEAASPEGMIGQGVGSTAAFILPRLIPGVGQAAMAGTAGLVGAGEAIDRAAAAGAEDPQQAKNALMGTAAGLTEIAPIEALFRASGVGGSVAGALYGMARSAVQQGLIEGTQEGVQTFMQNAIEQMTVSPDLDLTQDVGQGAAVGATVGALFGGTVGGVQQGAGQVERVQASRRAARVRREIDRALQADATREGVNRTATETAEAAAQGEEPTPAATVRPAEGGGYEIVDDATEGVVGWAESKAEAEAIAERATGQPAPEITPEDEASPIPTGDIAQGKRIIESAMEGGPVPQPDAPARQDSSPAPQPEATPDLDTFQPMFDSETDEQIGWVRPRDNALLGLDRQPMQAPGQPAATAQPQEAPGDPQDRQGLQGAERGGQEPGRAVSEPGRGGEAVEAGGVFQAPGQAAEGPARADAEGQGDDLSGAAIKALAGQQQAAEGQPETPPSATRNAPRARRQPRRTTGKPQSLAEFLSRSGGVQDQTGELRAMDADKWHRDKAFRRRIVRDDGLSPDYAREAAEEAGYLPEGSTIDDLYQALDQDLRQGDVYSAQDQTAVDEMRDAEMASRNRDAMERDALDLDIPEAAIDRMDDDQLAAAIAYEADARGGGDLEADRVESLIDERIGDDIDDWPVLLQPGSREARPFPAAPAPTQESAPPGQDAGGAGEVPRTGQGAGSRDQDARARDAGGRGEGAGVEPATPFSDTVIWNDLSRNTRERILKAAGWESDDGGLTAQGESLARKPFESQEKWQRDRVLQALRKSPSLAREGDTKVRVENRSSLQDTASWVVVRRSDGEVQFETSNRKTAEAINREKYRAIPAQEYLSTVNRAVKNAGGVEPDTSPFAEGETAQADQPARETEQTDQGEQTLMEGVRPVTDRDRLDARADAPMRGQGRQQAADEGLFDTGARRQTDLLDSTGRGGPKYSFRADPERVRDLTEQRRALVRERGQIDPSDDAAFQRIQDRIMPIARELEKLTGDPRGLDAPDVAAQFDTPQSGPDKALITKAKRTLGTTENPAEAGYLLPDGTMLDFSGRRQGAGREAAGQRMIDHRELGDVMGEGGTQAMIDFMNRAHAVRVDFNAGLFETQTEPTPKQLRAGVRAAEDMGLESLQVEISTPTGARRAGTEIMDPTVAKLRRFFQNPERASRGPMFALTARDEDVRTFSADLDALFRGEIDSQRMLRVGQTPAVLRQLGMPGRPLRISQRVVRKVVQGKHAVPPNTLSQLPQLMADPVMVLDSATQDGDLVAVLDARDQDGHPLVAAVAPASTEVRVNSIKTVFGKEKAAWFERQIDAGRLRYLNTENRPWFRQQGVQFPKQEPTAGTMNVLTPDDVVNARDGRLRLRDEFTDALPAIETALRERLRSLNLDDQISLRLRERIQGIADGQVREADGRYYLGLIEVSARAPDATRTLNHEVIHALRDLGALNTSEWSALSAAARRDQALMDRVQRTYAGAGLDEDAMVEEAVAEMYADWAQGNRSARGLIRRGFEKIRDVIRAISEALRGQGFTTAESVLRGVERGDVGARGQAGAQPRDARGRFTRGPRMAPAWHGSPHDFDEFSLQKIGTGEGAQAYGYGLYFAGKREVAQYYRDMLERPQFKTLRIGSMEIYRDGRLRDYSPRDYSPNDIARATLAEQIALSESELMEAYRENGKQGVKGKVRGIIAELLEDPGRDKAMDPWLKALDRGLEEARTPVVVDMTGQGRLYQVELAPSEDEYLYLDKPLSEQSEKVQRQLKPFLHPIRERVEREGPSMGYDTADEFVQDMSGRDIYENIAANVAATDYRIVPADGNGRGYRATAQSYSEALQEAKAAGGKLRVVKSNPDPKAASLALAEAGIPGLKFYDAVSRNQKARAQREIPEKRKAIADHQRYIEQTQAEIDKNRGRAGLTQAFFDRREQRIAEYQQLIDRLRQEIADAETESTTDYNYVIFDEKLIQVVAKHQLRQHAVKEAQPGVTTGADLFERFVHEPRPNVVEAMTDSAATLGERLSAAKSRDAINETVDDFRVYMQDRFLRVLRVEQAVEKALGRKLRESERPYLTEELSAGRKGSRSNDLWENRVRPLALDMYERGVSNAELEAYLYARHAPERNKRIAEINPKFRDSLTSDEAVGGSGMSNREAREIMQAVEKSGRKADFEALAEQVDEMLKEAMDRRVEAGLLSQAEADAWRATYQHYVPLRGEADLDPEVSGARPAGAKGVGVKGKESRRAFGRQTPARDILPYAIMQSQEAIFRGEDNKIAEALGNLATAMPNADFWEVNKVEKRPVWNKEKQEVEYRATPVTPEDKDYTITWKKNGVEHRLTFNRRNEKARQLADDLKGLSDAQLGVVWRGLMGLNRFLSSVNTTYNPEFPIVNAFRDAMTAGVNLSRDEFDGMVKQTLKHYPQALKGATKGAFNKRDMNDEWMRYYDEFVKAGGRVYFNTIEDTEQIRKRLTKDFENLKPGFSARKLAGSVMNAVENTNNGVENAIRLAAYRTAREKGWSQAEAASLAKNLTVNFNRRGKAGPQINGLYLFFNAAVQGNMVVINSLKSKRVRRIAAGMVATGLAVELLNGLVTGEDDDGELFYDKIPEHTKSRSLVIMTGTGPDDYVSPPLPYGYNVFFHMGRAMGELMRGKDALETGGDLIRTMIDSFNPIGGAEKWETMLSPTVADPWVEKAINEDWRNAPIYPTYPYSPAPPNSQVYYDSVGPHWRYITEGMSVLTGGDTVQPGLIEISPETMEHFFAWGTGAAGSFFDRNVGLAQKIFDSNAEININDISFARKIYGQKPSWYDRSAFYDRAEEIKQAEAALDEYNNKQMYQEAREFERKNRDLLSLKAQAETVKEQLSTARKQRDRVRKAYDEGRIGRKLYTRQIEQIEKAEERAVEEFNSAYIERVSDVTRTPFGVGD